jgi:hypothetical protein
MVCFRQAGKPDLRNKLLSIIRDFPMRRVLFVLVFLFATCGFSTGCKRAVGTDSNDKLVLEKLAPFNPVHKTDNNGYVIEIKLEGSHVTDEALVHVKELMDLRSLSLFGSSVTDNGLASLQSLEKLDSLGIGGTALTDKGLVPLRKIRTLRHIWLSEKNISPEAVGGLKKAIPELTVYFQ